MTRVAILLLAGFAVAPRAAAAQALDGAEAAERGGRLIEAEREYRGALAAGGLGPELTARAHLRLGVLARALGTDAAETESHFALALAIDPSLAAPAELPPDERQRFDALRGEGYRIEDGLDGRELTLTVLGAPSAARALRVGIAGGARDVALVDGVARITLPDDARSVDVTALDEHGNALVERTVEIPSPVAATATPRAPSLECPSAGDPCEWPPHCRPTGASCEEGGGPPWLLVGVLIGTGLAIAAGVLIAVLVSDAQQAAVWRIDHVDAP